MNWQLALITIRILMTGVMLSIAAIVSKPLCIALFTLIGLDYTVQYIVSHMVDKRFTDLLTQAYERSLKAAKETTQNDPFTRD